MLRHRVDRREVNHPFAAAKTAFVILAEPPVPPKPRKRPFNPPALRQDFESVLILFLLDNLQHGFEVVLDPVLSWTQSMSLPA